MKHSILIGLLIAMISLVGCQTEKNDKIKVAVSIVPQETYVKAITGDLVDVVVMIPPGFSPANYQPSPKQMVDFNDAELYFQIDVPAEVNIIEGIKNKNIKIVDLAELVDAKYPARYFDETVEDEILLEGDDHHHEGRDPHIWLSPRRVIVMIEAMRDELIQLSPDHAAEFTKNASIYIEELKLLDETFKSVFSSFEQKSFIIYHPSYGYLADDYDLEMVAIESDGKEATIKDLEHVIQIAKDKNVHVIFYQEEFDSQQAKVISKEIGGEAVKISPLSADYVNEMNRMVDILKDIFQ